MCIHINKMHAKIDSSKMIDISIQISESNKKFVML